MLAIDDPSTLIGHDRDQRRLNILRSFPPVRSQHVSVPLTASELTCIRPHGGLQSVDPAPVPLLSRFVVSNRMTRTCEPTRSKVACTLDQWI